jgi:hypothetical protein
LGELGGLPSFLRGIIFSIIVTLPLPLFYSISGSLSNDIDGMRFLFFSLLSSIEEKIILRGFAFWTLHKFARLGFWGFVLVPSLLFGFVHLFQVSEIVGVFGISTTGGIFFSWLLMHWENLWVFHICTAAGENFLQRVLPYLVVI